MFTIKVLRRTAIGEDRISIYQARSVDVFANEQDLPPGEKRVVFSSLSGSDLAVVYVTSDHTDASDFPPAHTVIIENMEGRTTEVVRPDPA